MFKKIFMIMAIFLFAVTLAACTEADLPDIIDNIIVDTVDDSAVPTDDPTVNPTLTIPGVAVQAGNFTTLVSALIEAGLLTSLEAEGPFTVFAPTDVAFTNLLVTLQMTPLQLLALDNLANILLYHVVPGFFDSAKVIELASNGPVYVETLLGQELKLEVIGGEVYVDDVLVILADVLASNGVIHVINDVLFPEESEVNSSIPGVAAGVGSFNILVSALTGSGLIADLETDGPFTVFAPTDQAFANLLATLDLTILELLALENLTDILLYHVVPGFYDAAKVIELASNGPVFVETLLGVDLKLEVIEGKVYVNDVLVTMADISASNGIIHVIGEVLLPETDPNEELVSIPATAIEAGNFTTLVAALAEAGLVTALEAEGPFTVFAPTDEAFADLLLLIEMTVEELLAFEFLSEILLYHVVPGYFDATTLIDLASEGPVYLETLQGQSLMIEVIEGSVYVDGFLVILADVFASNGVIHAIDGVLSPSGEENADTIPYVALNSGNFNFLATALLAAELFTALGAEGPFTVFAPSDEAFANLLLMLEMGVEEFLDLENLADILLYHVVPGYFDTTSIALFAYEGPSYLETLSGQLLMVELIEGLVYVDGVLVVLADISASNGVIHLIGEVLLPETDPNEELVSIPATAIEAGIFTTLVAALVETGLVTALEAEGPFTVFAPTNEAFIHLLMMLEMGIEEFLGLENLADILLYHVVPGYFDAASLALFANEGPSYLETLSGQLLMVEVIEGNIYVDGVLVVIADVFASNGVIHVINDVLFSETDINPELVSIPATAIQAGNFTTLVAALVEAGLVTALEADGPFTVFAPTDEAFANLLLMLEMTVEELLAFELLSEVLLYHVVPGFFDAATLIDLASDGPFYLETLQGQELMIEVFEGSVYVDGFLVILADVLATNGVIHAIDGVLFPADEEYFDTIPYVAIEVGDLNFLILALIETGLFFTLDAEGPFTVFAPNDEAFMNLLMMLEMSLDELLALENLADLLLYHVVSGFIDSEVVIELASNGPIYMETLFGQELMIEVIEGSVYVDGALVVLADVFASNGVIHVIDSFLFPEADPNEELVSIPATAIEAGIFTTLVAALVEAGLVTALEAEGPFTVFAPTDEAFANLLLMSEMTTEELLALEYLSDVLLYHVVPGFFDAATVILLASNGPIYVETLQGQSLMIEVIEGSVYVDGVLVVLADVLASNGVIHVINGVLFPADEVALNTIPVTLETEDFLYFILALVQRGVMSTLEAEGPFTVFAPNEDAFIDLMMMLEITLDPLMELEILTDILLYHIVPGYYDAAALMELASNGPVYLETLLGQLLMVEVIEGSVYVEGVLVVSADVFASNGVIHVISSVLLPEADPDVELVSIPATLTETGTFMTLLAALVEAGLVTALETEGPFTVFAPTEEAFANLLLMLEMTTEELLALENLSDILLFHVVPGYYDAAALMELASNGPVNLETLLGQSFVVEVIEGSVHIDGYLVSMSDIFASNGIIHAIDGVLYPAADVSIVELVSIVQTLTDAGIFTILLTAFVEAGLLTTLEEHGVLTIFAPTDDAFLAMFDWAGGVTVEDFLAVVNLADVLLLHVVVGVYDEAALIEIANGVGYIDSVFGQQLFVEVIEGSIYVNGVLVILADVFTIYGVIHFTDYVLLPSDDNYV